MRGRTIRPGLASQVGLVTNNKIASKWYSLLVTNNELAAPFDVTLLLGGTVIKLEEVLLDQRDMSNFGYLPNGFENASLGHSNTTHIAGCR